MWQSFVVGALMVLIACLGIWCIRRYPSPKNEFLSSRPNHFYFLLAFRSIVATCCIISLLWYASANLWLYYTTWNFTFQAIYYLWAIKHMWSHRNSNGSTPFDSESRALNILFDVSFSISFLVCLVFWGIIQPSKSSAPNFNSIFQHAINCALLLIDFALNGFVVRKSSLGYVLLLPLVYGIFSWIGHETWKKGFWPYKFLDISAKASPLWYFGVCAVHPVFLFLAIQLSKLKRRYLPQLCPNNGIELPHSVQTPIKDAADM